MSGARWQGIDRDQAPEIDGGGIARREISGRPLRPGTGQTTSSTGHGTGLCRRYELLVEVRRVIGAPGATVEQEGSLVSLRVWGPKGDY